eukprot:Phypoly_transcript_13583.p1 GENE.Phypoly_transcript_13583~~Phypoly_transcript_13583.p1  ORF type:complete len:310 (+),score=40.87 Phypoly_transcript_13583:96-932(+)
MSAVDILVRCSCVCKRWHDIIGNSVELWQTLLSRDYKTDVTCHKRKRPTSWKREYENIFRRLLCRENAVESSVKAFPLFDVEMLSASINSNIGNLNRPRINLQELALLLSQPHPPWNAASVITLELSSVVLLSHVLSRFCAEFLYDAGMVAVSNNCQTITPDCIRVIMQANPFFPSSILSAMVGSPIRIHPQNIYNVLNALRWENPEAGKDPITLTLSRQALAIVISFAGDIAAQLVHAAIAVARKRHEQSVDRTALYEIVSSLFPPEFVDCISSSDY